MDWLQKKAYDTVTQSRIIDCLKMYKISGAVILYQKYHAKQENRTDSMEKKLNWGENPERGLPGRCTIIITISNSDATAQLHT